MNLELPLHLSEHHKETIYRVTDRFMSQSDTLALLLTGSLAHGFASPSSDVDIAIVVNSDRFSILKQNGRLALYDEELCTYPGGYVDGKFMDIEFIKEVAVRGSEPSRFAFKDAVILFSRLDNLEEIVQAASRFPIERKPENISRFLAQFEAWNWYLKQALQKNDLYLLRIASLKLALFGSRLILTHNNLLFPYHKWLTRILFNSVDKPTNLENIFHDLIAFPSGESAASFYSAIKNFTHWPSPEISWSMQFMLDSELNWVEGEAPVDDI